MDVVTATSKVHDCPECYGVGTVVVDVCLVCFAEFGEEHDQDRFDDYGGSMSA
jgi:hypothetical protein